MWECSHNQNLNSQDLVCLYLWNYVTVRLFFFLKKLSFFHSEFCHLCEKTLKYLGILSVVFFVRFFCNSLESTDCVSKTASSQPLEEATVTDKETSVNNSDCPDGQSLVDRTVAPSSSDQIPDEATGTADDEAQSSETDKFTRTISPPALGTLRSCFSWSGSLGGFSRTPSPSPRAALQQFRRKSDPLTPLPAGNETSEPSQLKSQEAGDEPQPSQEARWSSQSQESVELSPHSLNVSSLSQPSSKDSDSEVRHIRKPLFSNSCVRENRMFIR